MTYDRQSMISVGMARYCAKARHDFSHIPALEERWNQEVVCPTCGGTGETVSYESVPYGMGFTDMQIVDLCGCVDGGFCPRCGSRVLEVEGVESDYFACQTCHWTDSPAVLPHPFLHYEGDGGLWWQEKSKELQGEQRGRWA